MALWMHAFSFLLSALATTVQASVETSPEHLAEPTAVEVLSEKREWFWKTGFGGLGGGFSIIGNGGSTGIGNGGGLSTIFFTSYFTETIPGPPITETFTLPGFTTTIFATQSPDQGTTEVTTVFVTTSAPAVTTVTSITTIPTTTTITQS